MRVVRDYVLRGDTYICTTYVDGKLYSIYCFSVSNSVDGLKDYNHWL